MTSASVLHLAVAVLVFFNPPNEDIKEIEKQIERGRMLLGTPKDDQGKSECRKALEALKAAAVKKPKDAQIQFLIGKTSFYLQQNEHAREAYRRAIELAPKTASYHFMLGILEKYADKPEEAAKQIQIATGLAPAESEYWFELAGLLDQLKQPDRALRAAMKAVETDSKNIEALRLAGSLEADQGKFEDALEYFVRASALDPQDIDLHYNCGQMSQNLDKPRDALKSFEAVAKLAPDDWRTQAKIVQCSESIGEKSKRDKARECLQKLKRSNKIDKELFVRDQFKVAGKFVMALEYFELKGDEAVRYSFNVVNKSGEKPSFRISLGSYDVTNEHAHAAGEIGQDERLFHLDRYEGQAHQTFSFFHNEPSYEMVKKMVVEILEGKRKPISSMTPTSQGTIIELNEP